MTPRSLDKPAVAICKSASPGQGERAAQATRTHDGGVMRFASGLMGVWMLAGCSPWREAVPPDGIAPTPADAAEACPDAVNRRGLTIHSGRMDFDYSYPADIAAIPALAAMLESDLAQHLQETQALGQDTATRVAFDTCWAVAAETTRWLVLWAERGDYTGGAHAGAWNDALLWDKEAGSSRDPLSFFDSATALGAVIRGPFCDQIDAQRTERRGEPVMRDSGDRFDECPDPVDMPLIFGSSDKVYFDQVIVLVGPEVAGPFKEGSYRAILPVTDALIDAVKPSDRAYFSVKP